MTRKRRFLNFRKTEDTGHEFNLRLRKNSDDGSYRVLFVDVWHGGKMVDVANVQTRGVGPPDLPPLHEEGYSQQVSSPSPSRRYAL